MIEAMNQLNEDQFIKINIIDLPIHYSDSLENINFIEVSNTDSILIHDVLDGQFETLLFEFSNSIDDELVIALKGSAVELVENVFASIIIGFEEYSINFEFYDEIYWLRLSNLENYSSDLDFISVFISYINMDVNQDEIWDILDIVLTVNFIMGNTEPANIQFDSADLNDDNILDILDIVIMVNLIIG